MKKRTQVSGPMLERGAPRNYSYIWSLKLCPRYCKHVKNFPHRWSQCCNMWAKFFKVEINKELFKINHESLVIDKSGNLLYMQYVKIEKKSSKGFCTVQFPICFGLCLYMHVFVYIFAYISWIDVLFSFYLFFILLYKIAYFSPFYIQAYILNPLGLIYIWVW